MQRACAAALLRHGITNIHQPGYADDDKAALNIIEHLGAQIHQQATDSITITSKGAHPKTQIIHSGESGLSARLFTTIAALSNDKLTITGNGSLLKRPMSFFGEILPQLGVQLFNFNGYLPITLEGPLRPQDIYIDGSLSSQFLTGLLFAYSFTTDKETLIKVNNLTSKPYIDLTLQVLSHFGKKIEHENYQRFRIKPTQENTNTIDYTVEADWSSTAYWVVGGIINGDLQLEGLNENSLQADRIILDIVKQCGGECHFKDNILHVKKTENLRAFHFDATDAPDLFPILSILAAVCKGSSEIKGLHRLKHKESDREESIKNMLRQLGVSFEIANDTLKIEGTTTFRPAVIDSYNDHRIAMSAAIAALHASGSIVIAKANCVSKSYPDFFKHFEKLSQ